MACHVPSDMVISYADPQWLSQEHGLARQTVAKAFGLLVDEGLVVRIPGLGYYVAEH